MTSTHDGQRKRSAVITGAGSGLGRGLSLCLAQQGHSILATDRNLEGARETVAAVQQVGGTAEGFALDVTSEADIQRLMADEITPTLTIPAGVDVAAYRRRLIERFADPGLAHRTWQIAMDGSQKLPQRLLGTIAERQDVRLIYVRGSHALIGARIAARHDHFMPPSLLQSQFDTLEEPGADERPIIADAARTPAAMVEQVLAELIPRGVPNSR